MSVAPASPAAAPARGTAPSSSSAARAPAPGQSFAETLESQVPTSPGPELPLPAAPMSLAATPANAPAATSAHGPPTSTPGGGLPDPDAKPKRDPRRDEDQLDPLTRHTAQLAPPPMLSPAVTAAAPGAAPSAARLSLEEVLPALVRRVAWSGDGRRATMRLELGTGQLAGATLLIHAEQGRVRVELSAPAGVDKAAWRERLMVRLQGRGVNVDSLEVD